MIAKEFSGLKLDHDQKEMVRESIKQGKNRQEIHKQVLQAVEEKGNYDRRSLKKAQNMAPLYDAHDFWDSQPVPKAYETVTQDMYDKPIDVDKKPEDIKQEPLSLPPGFYWANVNIKDPVQAQEVYELLTQNYVEDDDNMFRFDYSIEFLQWALTPPGFHEDWIFGVRGGKKNKLFGFISGIPVHMNIRGKQ